MKSKVVVDTKAWHKLQKQLEGLDKAHVKVGILASKGGTADHGDGISIVELAAIHEFGSPKAGIPERSFIRGTFQANQSELKKLSAKLGKDLITYKISHRKALETLGLWGEAEVKKFVTASGHVQPELKPQTIRAKGSSRPLVDTGRMINAVTHEVKL